MGFCFELSLKVMYFVLVQRNCERLSLVGSTHKTFTHGCSERPVKETKKKCETELTRVHWTEWISNSIEMQNSWTTSENGRGNNSAVFHRKCLPDLHERRCNSICVCVYGFMCEREAIATNYLCRTRHFSLALFPVHCVRYALYVYFKSRKIIMDFSVNFNAVKMFETATKLYFKQMFPQRRATRAMQLKFFFCSLQKFEEQKYGPFEVRER